MNINQQNIKQALIENIAEFLDNEFVTDEENACFIGDPVSREESDLHIKMAEAAMQVYLSVVKKCKPSR